MKEHIILNDVTKQIRKNNLDYAIDIIEKMKDAVRPIRDNAEAHEKADESIIVGIYVRK